MFLFWRLFLAHLVADYPLQTGWVFREKTEHTWGVVYHGSVAGVLGFALAGPYLRYPKTWLVLIGLWLFHIFLDKGKTLLNSKVVRSWWLVFIADQALHVGSVWVAAILINGPELGRDVFLWGNDTFFQLASAYVISAYSLQFLVSSIKGSRPGDVPIMPRLSLRLVESGERIAITTLALLGGMFLVAIPLCVLPRLILKREKPGEIAYWEIILSLILSAGVGMFFRYIVFGHLPW
jgi:hypothetical protein